VFEVDLRDHSDVRDLFRLHKRTPHVLGDLEVRTAIAGLGLRDLWVHIELTIRTPARCEIGLLLRVDQHRAPLWSLAITGRLGLTPATAAAPRRDPVDILVFEVGDDEVLAAALLLDARRSAGGGT
jgi:hypothetical protein